MADKAIRNRQLKADPSTRAVIARINRLQGQVGGLRGMVEQGRDCHEVLRQVAAVSGASKGLWRQIMELHLKKCLAKPQSVRGRNFAVRSILDAIKHL